ncbi:terminase family protein, partial [Salmonella enterica]|nr:terminase family protein [Salmonella enterica]
MTDSQKHLVALTPPRKIDLAGQKALLGVDVPESLDLPKSMPVLLGYQVKWFKDDSQICIAEKSRRTGLTWAEAARNVITAAKPKKRGGRNVFYVGSKQEMALEYISACALFARAFNQLAQADVYEQTFWDSEKKEEILTYMIRFPNSSFKIQALSSRPSNLRGLQGDVVIDEAAFHESLDELLKAAMALTMWGARVRIISTHNGVDNLFNQYIQEAREGRKDYSVHRITLDDAIADGLYQRICYVTGQTWSPEAQKKWRDDLYKNAPGKEDADEEYGCVPKKSGGAYIPHALIELAMVRGIPILTFEAPEDFLSRAAWLRESEINAWCEEHLKPLLTALNPRSRYSFGEDFARRGDLTCFTALEITEDLQKREAFRV